VAHLDERDIAGALNVEDDRRPQPTGARGRVLAATPLAWGRIVLGSVFVLRTTPLASPLHFDFTAGTYPLLGWPTSSWHGSILPFALPPSVVAVLCVTRTIAAVLFALGMWTRAAGLFAGAAGYLVMLEHPFAFDATLQMLFEGTFLLALTDAGATLALRPVAAKNPASGILLIRIFVASIYFWAGVAKLRPDWLDGRTLELFQKDGAFTGPLANLVLATPMRRMFVGCAVAGTELSLPVLLFWSKTRRFAPFIALSMHAGIELAAHPDLIGWVIGGLLLCLWPEPEPNGTSPTPRATR
jgi:uncharacterized membrane protein YphA (DoxX/SURF4 family)